MQNEQLVIVGANNMVARLGGAVSRRTPKQGPLLTPYLPNSFITKRSCVWRAVLMTPKEGFPEMGFSETVELI